MTKRRTKNPKVPYVSKSERAAKAAGAATSVEPAVGESAEEPAETEIPMQDLSAPAAPEVAELPTEPTESGLPDEDLSALLATSGMPDEPAADAGEAHPESVFQDAKDAAPVDLPPEMDFAESASLHEAPAAPTQETVSEAVTEETAHEPEVQAEPEMPVAAEPAEGTNTFMEFEDASAALAESLHVEPADRPEASAIRSIPMPDVSELDFLMAAEAGAAATHDAPPADSTEAAESESLPEPTDEAPAAASMGGKGRKRLKLNKLQKHARETPEAEVPAPEPEPAPVFIIERAPRGPRIPAFAKLTEYQSLSLAHVPGLPEEADVPGHWRGVGFGIGGRRLVSAFDEVVEIMRLPQITHVPGTQPWMLGVANVRGTLLPVVDLKQFLEGERTVMHEGQRVLVVRQAGGNVAVLIDQLFGQRSFNDSQKSDEKAASGTRYDHFIKQFYRVGDNDWGVFSMSMLTRTPEFRQAAA